MELPNYEKYIRSIAAKLLKEKSIDGAKVQLSPGSNVGDNYSGELTKVTVSHENLNESWIFKLPNSDPKLRESLNVDDLFNREIFSYEKLFPILDSLQDELKIEGEDRFKHAKCLYTNREKYSEVVVLEDLTPKGYTTIKRTETFSWEMLQLSIKTMANFHALSFNMKTKSPGEFKKLTENFEWTFRPHILDMSMESMRQCRELVTNKSHKERLEKFMVDLRQKLKENSERITPYSVFIQGDSWIKNLMFKFEDGKPIDLILIDWQVCRLSSPVLDLFMILFINTGSEIRRQYLKKALDLYYDHLTKRLHTLGLDIETCYPKSVFEEDIKSYSIYGIVVGLTGPSLIHAEDGLDLVEINKEGANFKHSTKSIQQMNEALNDSIEFGFI